MRRNGAQQSYFSQIQQDLKDPTKLDVVVSDLERFSRNFSGDKLPYDGEVRGLLFGVYQNVLDLNKFRSLVQSIAKVSELFTSSAPQQFSFLSDFVNLASSDQKNFNSEISEFFVGFAMQEFQEYFRVDSFVRNPLYQQDYSGGTPINVSLDYKLFKLSEILLRNGSDANSYIDVGRQTFSPIQRLISNAEKKRWDKGECVAAAYLLISHGSDFTQDDLEWISKERKNVNGNYGFLTSEHVSKAEEKIRKKIKSDYAAETADLLLEPFFEYDVVSSFFLIAQEESDKGNAIEIKELSERELLELKYKESKERIKIEELHEDETHSLASKIDVLALTRIVDGDEKLNRAQIELAEIDEREFGRRTFFERLEAQEISDFERRNGGVLSFFTKEEEQLNRSQIVKNESAEFAEMKVFQDELLARRSIENNERLSNPFEHFVKLKDGVKALFNYQRGEEEALSISIAQLLESFSEDGSVSEKDLKGFVEFVKNIDKNGADHLSENKKVLLSYDPKMMEKISAAIVFDAEYYEPGNDNVKNAMSLAYQTRYDPNDPDLVNYNRGLSERHEGYFPQRQTFEEMARFLKFNRTLQSAINSSQKRRFAESNTPETSVEESSVSRVKERVVVGPGMDHLD